MTKPMQLPRRHLLQTLGALGAWYALAAQAQNVPDEPLPGRLVVIFLRGAYDGLSALVPYADADYYRLRPNIAIAPPDGTAHTTLKLDATFGLHPALAPLLPLWQQGLLAAIPCAGSPDPTRSHFDAQHHWETGLPGQSRAAAGWLNTLAGFKPLAGANRAAAALPTVALGVGEANPQILAGPNPVQLVPRGQAASRAGVLADARTRDAVLKLYGGNDTLASAFRRGADSRQHTADTLNQAMQTNLMQTQQQMAAADGAAGPAKGLLLDAQHLATLMRQDAQLRLGFLSAGGWDTHANQGAATGALAQNLGDLAATLVQLRRDFSQPNDVVLVASEFGRTSAENGTRGTDHGHGNALWLLGSAVNGGRWHGQWSGLAQGNLHEGRDLPVQHDFRSVLAQLLRRTQGIDSAGLSRLFAGYVWDNSLNGLMRA